MRKVLYIVYALTVVSVMGRYSYAPPAHSAATNANSYYHGGSSIGSGSAGAGHK